MSPTISSTFIKKSSPIIFQVTVLLLLSFPTGCVNQGTEMGPTTFPPVEQNHVRSEFIEEGNHGMVVAGHHLAAEAGRDMLKAGGNAIDAAIASSFVISVVRPHSTGLGGGGFLISHDSKTKKTRVLDFRERAPLKSHRAMFLDANGHPLVTNIRGTSIKSPSMDGPLSIATPGLVQGLFAIQQEQGKLPLSQVMAPAIRIARQGFKVYPTLAKALDERAWLLGLFPGSRKIFFKNDKPLKLGDTLIQEDLAQTLERIAQNGLAEMTTGLTAQRIIKTVEAEGGILSLHDLERFKIKRRDPVTGYFRGHKIISMPPPSSGGLLVIQMLQVLEHDALKEMYHSRRIDFITLVAETMRRSFALRSEFFADPDFEKVPMDTLGSLSFAKKIRSSINLQRATPSSDIKADAMMTQESSSTTHISAIDRTGLAVATTQTINYLFGSGIVAEGTGIVLNDEMDDFTSVPGQLNAFGLKQGAKNEIAPLKTPLSSMSPTIILDDKSRVKLILGSPGGPRIITAVFQTILNYIGLDMPFSDAVHAHRIHHQWLPDELKFEPNSIDAVTHQNLQDRGYTLKEMASIGDVEAIAVENGHFTGVADTRAEGRAAGL
jgi:gamma-glutamyltranspeptidase / glutathione hydrolase